MAQEYLLYGTDKRVLSSRFDGKPHPRSIKFTDDPGLAYRWSVIRYGDVFNKYPVVMVLNNPKRYHPREICSRGFGQMYQLYAINLRRTPINHHDEDVSILEKPSLEELCALVEELRRKNP